VQCKGNLPAIISFLKDKRTRIAAVIVVIAAAVFFVFRPTVDKDADRFVNALLNRNWAEAYRDESVGEKEQLGWDEPTFIKFCDALSRQGWPIGRRPKIDEILPIVTELKAGDIGADDSWNRAGSREYMITLYRGTVSEQAFQVQFRHGPDGEWHPDVLSSLLRVNTGGKTRGANPQRNLLEAMQAIGATQITLYPVGDHTDLSMLGAYLMGQTKMWLEPGAEPLR
jgi:hypothetical protein